MSNYRFETLALHAVIRRTQIHFPAVFRFTGHHRLSLKTLNMHLNIKQIINYVTYGLCPK